MDEQKVVEQVGTGANGVVVRAIDTNTGGIVAIKSIKTVCPSTHAQKRFDESDTPCDSHNEQSTKLPPGALESFSVCLSQKLTRTKYGSDDDLGYGNRGKWRS